MRRVELCVLLISLSACSEERKRRTPPCECPEPVTCPSVASSTASAPSASAPSVATLDLPRPAGGSAVQVLLAVDISADGKAWVDGKVASDDELSSAARAALARDPDIRATVRADGDVPHRRVMEIVDMLKRAGIHKIAFGVTQKPASP